MNGTQHFSWPTDLPPPFEVPRIERRDAAEHRQRILEVARQLFAERGIEAVSMHQIARAAGVGQGTLYRRYAHKGALCLDLMQERHAQFVDEIAELFAERESALPLERLEGVLKLLVDLLEEQSALMRLAALEGQFVLCAAAEQPPHGALQQAPFYSWLHGLCARLLSEAVERGDLAQLDVLYTTDALLATLHPLIYHFQRQERGFTPERILQGLRRIYIDGVRSFSPALSAKNAREIP